MTDQDVMDAGLAVEVAAIESQRSIETIIERGDSNIQQFYNDTTIFITGGSGFIGKQLIEILFRTCSIKKLYILLRPKKRKHPNERLIEILKDPIFELLHRKRPGFVKKLVVIEGDVSELNLRISGEDRIILSKEVEVIFHVAATIAFDEPLRSAILTNVRGTREIISLAKECSYLKALLYLSTAYSHATMSRNGCEVLEQFYPCPLPPNLIIKLAEDVEESRLNNIKPGLIMDWPNTYTFTKALAEEVLRVNAADLPACVLRPAVVICSRQGPCPGWVDINSVYGPSGCTLGTLMGVIHVLHTNPGIRIDFVPVDYVCNTAIASAVTAKKQPLTVYQIGTSCRNSLTWDKLTYIFDNKVRKTVISDKAMWYNFVIQTRNKWVYLFLRFLLHDLPAFIIDSVLMVMGKQPRLTKIYRLINKISSTFIFYMNNDWIFDDRNTLKLYENLSDTDKTIYYHDIKDINWTEMIFIWYIGLRKYIVKDGLKNTKLGMRRQLYFKLATYFICILLIYLWLLFIYMICF